LVVFPLDSYPKELGMEWNWEEKCKRRRKVFFARLFLASCFLAVAVINRHSLRVQAKRANLSVPGFLGPTADVPTRLSASRVQLAVMNGMEVRSRVVLAFALLSAFTVLLGGVELFYLTKVNELITEGLGGTCEKGSQGVVHPFREEK
jgi:hypothetical protein